MSFTTTSSTNEITIGDTNSTIYLNQIFPMYSSTPTPIDLSYVGGFIVGTSNGSSVSVNSTTSATYIYKFDNVPVGKYLAFCHFSVTATGEYGFDLIISNSPTAYVSSPPDTVVALHSTTWRYDTNYFYNFVVPYENASKRTVYINFFSGPGSGKSTNCYMYYGYLLRVG